MSLQPAKLTLQPAKLKDEVLVDLIVNHNRQELLTLVYKRYSKKVYFQCYNIVKDTEVAKDLAQDVLLKVFGKLSQFKGTSNFSMWVRAIAYNYSIDYLRKRNRMYFESYEEEVMNVVAYDDDGIREKVLFEERAAQIQHLISFLKEKDQAVIRMRYYQGMSIKEISERIGSGVSATKMRLKRAKSRLMEKASEVAMCS